MHGDESFTNAELSPFESGQLVTGNIRRHSVCSLIQEDLKPQFLHGCGGRRLADVFTAGGCVHTDR
jgi:hypothetical protein